MSERTARLRRWALRAALAVGALLLVIQLVPYGRTHTNPRVTDEAPWPSDRARELAVAACYDCHSNETEWPLYADVAPMSWLIARDVEEGREALNFSTWAESDADAGDAAEELVEGAMPPARYLPIHPDARLSDEDKAILVAALEEIDDRADGSGPGDGSGRDDDDGSEDDGDDRDEGGDGTGPRRPG